MHASSVTSPASYKPYPYPASWERALTWDNPGKIALSAILNTLPYGIILLNAKRHVVLLNRYGKNLIGNGLVLQDNHLSTPNRQNTSRLNALISTVLNDKQQAPSAPIILQRPAHTSPLIVQAVTAQGIAAVRVIVLINDPDWQLMISPELLRSIYQLTTAEARLAVLLAKGLSLNQIAENLDIALGTVRNHLKAIYQKTLPPISSNQAKTLARVKRLERGVSAIVSRA
jgi:hypothetical protein